MLHGDADQIVPFNQGRSLYDQAAQPRTFICVPGGRHCDAVDLRHGDTYRKIILDFFAQDISAPQ